MLTKKNYDTRKIGITGALHASQYTGILMGALGQGLDGLLTVHWCAHVWFMGAAECSEKHGCYAGFQSFPKLSVIAVNA